MSKYYIFDLICKVKLGCLAGTVLRNESSEHLPHLVLLEAAGERGCWKKRKSEAHLPVLIQMGTILFPIPNMFRPLLEYFFTSSSLSWKWIFHWFYFHNNVLETRSAPCMLRGWPPPSQGWLCLDRVRIQFCLVLLQEKLKISLEPTWFPIGNKLKSSGVPSFLGPNCFKAAASARRLTILELLYNSECERGSVWETWPIKRKKWSMKGLCFKSVFLLCSKRQTF